MGPIELLIDGLTLYVLYLVVRFIVRLVRVVNRADREAKR